MKYFKVTFDNGYAGCDDERYLAMPDEESVEEYCRYELSDYAEENINGAAGWDWYEGWESDEAEEEYYDGCSWSYEEITKEEYDENVE